jgi:hypothetical protein
MTTSDDGFIRVWDMINYKCIKNIHGIHNKEHFSEILSLNYDHSLVAVAGPYKNITILVVNTLEPYK